MNCQDCECHDFLQSKGIGFNGDYRGRGHWCMFDMLLELPYDDIRIVITDEKYMTYKQYKQTPEWCPKNEIKHIYDGIECKVLRVKRHNNY